MNLLLLLFGIGVVLLAAEVFVPGGILGIFGGLALLGAVILAFVDLGAGAGWTTLAAAVATVGLLLYVELGLLPKTRTGRRLFLNAAVDGTSQELPARPDVVGKPAEALTTLAPTGYVIVEGRRYEAFSQSGLVPKGTALRVVGLDNFRLIVSKT
ncbi:MAG TPA: NfeD family protein [Opitutaceae bacterium]